MYRYALSLLSSLLIGCNVCSALTNNNLAPEMEGGGIPTRC